MTRREWTTFLAVLCLVPAATRGQSKKAERAQKQIAAVVADFNDEMRGYEREMRTFRQIPEYPSLFELRTQLVNQAAEVAALDKAGAGPAIRELAPEFDRNAHDLKVMTGRLEKRADAVGDKESRRVTDRMKAHADKMVQATDKLNKLLR
jgi:hypothetical protein